MQRLVPLMLLLVFLARSLGVLPGSYAQLLVVGVSWAVLVNAIYVASRERLREDWAEALKPLVGFIIVFYAVGFIVGYGVNSSAPTGVGSTVYTLLVFYAPSVARFSAIAVTASVWGLRVGVLYGLLLSTAARIGYREVLGSLGEAEALMGLFVYEVVPSFFEAVAAVAVSRHSGVLGATAYSAVLGALVYLAPVLPLLDWRIIVLSVAGLNAVTVIYLMERWRAWGRGVSRFLPYRLQAGKTAWEAVLVTVLLGGALFMLSQGYRGFIVASGSMEPTVMRGDLVVVAPMGGVAPRPGDVVAYVSPDGRVVVHRVVEVVENGREVMVITKGDANPDPDPPVPLRAVLGRVVFRVPLVGHLVAALSRPLGGPYGLSLAVVSLYAMGSAIAGFAGSRRRWRV